MWGADHFLRLEADPAAACLFTFPVSRLEDIRVPCDYFEDSVGTTM